MRYKVSKSLIIQFNHKGQLVATTSMSRPPQKIEPDGIFVLRVFGNGNAPEEAMKTLAEECEFDADGFNEVFKKLVSENFLIPAGSEDDNIASSNLAQMGFAAIGSHHRMVRDAVRVNAYRNAIAANVRDKVVVEIGCGSGIFSLFAAQYGARQVIAIEETEIAELAKEMVQANGFEKVIRVVTGSSRDVELQEPVDVIIHEIIGNDPFAENILPSIADARERFFGLRRGRFIPARLEVCCAGLEIDEKNLLSRERELKEAGEFSRQYGLNFDPFIKRLSPGEKSQPLISYAYDRQAGFPFGILSQECVLYDIDFLDDWGDMQTPRTHTLEIEKPGDLNGLVIFFRAHLDERTQLTNSPFAPKTHWEWNFRGLSKRRAVKPGDRIKLSSGLIQTFNVQRMEVDIV
jgi:protein arginine N-methyltransferase 1